MAGVTRVALTFPPGGRFWDSSTTNTGLRSGPGRPAFQVYDGSSDFDGRHFTAITFFALATDIKSDAELAVLCAQQLAEMWSSETHPGKANEVNARVRRLLEAAADERSWTEERARFLLY